MSTTACYPPIFEPSIRDVDFRVAMTSSCRDADLIPKVSDAGKIVVENGVSVQIMHNGLRVVAGGYWGDWMADIINRLKGHHEPQEERVFYEILKFVSGRAVMLELGGFWSYYSLWFVQKAPALRRAIVVEPDPNNLEVGRRNASLNSQSIEFVHASIGEVAEDMHSFTSETAGMIVLPQTTVPELLDRFDIDRLDILHCDIQGGETGVIRSSRELLEKKRIRFGIFSTHAHQISGDPLTHQRCLALLREYGGVILAEHDVHEGFSGDGMIAAYFGEEPIDWPQIQLSYNRYSTSLFRNPLYDLADARKGSPARRRASLA